jgi:hypothetical protein
MKTIKVIVFVTLILVTGVWCGCKKDKKQVSLPPPVLNSPELITSLVIQFTDSSNVATLITAAFRDPDGPGGNPPSQFDTIKLAPNKTYFVKLIVLDETKSPIDTVSKEIWNERNDHQFFFAHNGVSINTIYLDIDANGYPVGLSSKWRTYSSGFGTSRVILKHQAGTKNGTQQPGETDLDVTFYSKIQ